MISCDFHNNSLTKKCTHFTDEGMRLEEMQVSSQDGIQTQDCLVSKTLIQELCRALQLKKGFHVYLIRSSHQFWTIYKKDYFFLWMKKQEVHFLNVPTLVGGNPGPLLCVPLFTLQPIHSLPWGPCGG